MRVIITTMSSEKRAKKEILKTCFVIAPIGSKESDIRYRSDQELRHIIKPAAEECGYRTVRADEISEPGIITSQIIQHLIDDNLVIADLTGKNPNVFYELAIRHAVKKPVIQIVKYDESIPFDVAPTRTIQVDHRDLDSAANCRDELVKQICSVEENPEKVDSPISVAVDLKGLRQSENLLEKSNAEIIFMLQDIRAIVLESIRPSLLPHASVEKIADFVEDISSIYADDVDELRYILRSRLYDFLSQLTDKKQNQSILIQSEISKAE